MDTLYVGQDSYCRLQSVHCECEGVMEGRQDNGRGRRQGEAGAHCRLHAFSSHHLVSTFSILLAASLVSTLPFSKHHSSTCSTGSLPL